jgi:hypothetical protein
MTSTPEPPGADPHAGWRGRGAIATIAPYAWPTGGGQMLNLGREVRE